MLDEILRMLEQKFKEEGQEEEGELIGKLPNELHLKLKSLKKERERFVRDVEFKKDQYQMEALKKLEAEFDELNDELSEKHRDIWNEVYQAMLVDSEGKYYQENGYLYQYKDGREKASIYNVDFTKPRR